MGREGENEGSDGGMGGEEGGKVREVFGGDDDGDGDVVEGETVGEVEKRQHVALSRVREHQNVRVRVGRHCG